MSEKNNSIQMFEDRQIRTAWNAEQEEWYFSVTDVIAVLTDSADPKQYIKKMRSRDSELDARWGTICTLTSMVASDGKKYRTNAATMEGIFRIIQPVDNRNRGGPSDLLHNVPCHPIFFQVVEAHHQGIQIP